MHVHGTTSVRGVLLGAALAMLVAPVPRAWAEDSTGDQVVLLHGLLRSSSSMSRLADALTARGFEVCNVSYPSRRHSIAVLAAGHVAPAVERCFPGSGRAVHFVTHSLGGIVVRQLAETNELENIGRVVMLAPPNHGSELVDEFGHWWLFERINGPAGRELGTNADSVPMRLGPAPFEAGIITGDRTTNLVLSAFLPRGNDGKVSVASARLEGMKDFLVIPVSHTFIMRHAEVIRQTVGFLEHGRFDRAPARKQRI